MKIHRKSARAVRYCARPGLGQDATVSAREERNAPDEELAIFSFDEELVQQDQRREQQAHVLGN